MFHLIPAILFSVAVCASDDAQVSPQAKLPEVVWLGGLIPYKIDKAFKSIEELLNKAKDESENTVSENNEGTVNKAKFSEYEAILERIKQSLKNTVEKEMVTEEYSDFGELGMGNQTNSTTVEHDLMKSTDDTTVSASITQAGSQRESETIDEPELTTSEAAVTPSERAEKRSRRLTEDGTSEKVLGEVDASVDELPLKPESKDLSILLEENQATNYESTTQSTETTLQSNEELDNEANTTEILTEGLEETADPFARKGSPTIDGVSGNNHINQGHKGKIGSSIIKDNHNMKKDHNELDEKNTGANCSAIKQLLEPVAGSHSLFEESLKNGSKIWTLGQKIGLAKLLRRIHMVISLYRNDPKRQFQIVRDVIKMYVAREPSEYKERVLGLDIITLGKLHDFISCNWQDY